MSTKALLLSGGYGTRLSPLSDIWPKCLMPIKKKPLLEYWIDSLHESGVDEILINLHYLSNEVKEFLERDKFKGLINWVYEEKLLGTAGTLIKNHEFFRGGDILLAHADNFCSANLSEFMDAHEKRPKSCIATMMTFTTDQPESCGIVTTNKNDILIDFHEKVLRPPSNIANAAVYMLSEEFLEWIAEQSMISDFSLDVIPRLLGRIRAWNNEGIHIDIGTIENLLKSQDFDRKNSEIHKDEWQYSFLNHPIHTLIDEAREKYAEKS